MGPTGKITSADKVPPVPEHAKSSMTLQFVKNNRATLMERFEKIGFATTATFGTAGFLAAFTGFVAVISLLGAGTAAMVTPIGWAALGIAAIGILLLICRHVIMANAHENPHTLKALMANIGFGVIFGTLGILCYVCAAMFDELPPMKERMGGFKAWLENFWIGYAIGSLSHDIPIVIPAPTVDEEGSDKTITTPQRYLVYKDDVWAKNENGQIIISEPSEQNEAEFSEKPFPLC